MFPLAIRDRFAYVGDFAGSITFPFSSTVTMPQTSR